MEIMSIYGDTKMTPIEKALKMDWSDLYDKTGNDSHKVRVMLGYARDKRDMNATVRRLLKMKRHGVARKMKYIEEAKTNEVVHHNGELWLVPPENESKFKPQPELLNRLEAQYQNSISRLFQSTFQNPRIQLWNLEVQLGVEPTYTHRSSRCINLTVNPGWPELAKHTCDGYMPVAKVSEEPKEGRYRIRKIKCWDLSEMRKRKGQPASEVKYLATLDDKTAGIADTVALAIMKVNNKLMKTTREML
jgi:hypothetical protein